MEIPDKATLRKEFLKKRDGLEEDLRLRHSSMIRQRILGHPAWKSAERILCYVSFGSEVETHTIIQEALRFRKRVMIPIHDAERHGTPISEIKRFGELTTTHRGILQVDPQFRRLVDPAQVDLALIPGIAFDRLGTRLGFGGGYFDKLLPFMPKAVRMALAFENQVAHVDLPMETHDIRMHFIVTEKQIIAPTLAPIEGQDKGAGRTEQQPLTTPRSKAKK